MRIATTLALLILALPLFGQEKVTEHTVRLPPEATPEAATVADLAWLAGTWTGDGLGGRTEEVWTAPDGGVMLGMFRLLRNDKPMFYELLTISETPRGLAMRLKHFNPDMTAWEEKEKVIEFRYVRTRGNEVQFDGLTFRRDSDTELTIFLALRGKDGEVKEQTFKMKGEGRKAKGESN